MLQRLSTHIIKRLRASYCVQNQTRSQIETTQKIDDLEKTQLEWIILAQQKNDNHHEEEEDVEETKQAKKYDDEESESESDDDDEPKGGRKIPLIELVKGFIPRLLKPDLQE